MSQAVAAIRAADHDLNVVARKKFTVEAQDEFPLVVVWPEIEEETGEDHSEYEVEMLFPIGVAIVLDSSSLVNHAELTDMLTLRQNLRRALRSVKVVAPSPPATITGVRAILNTAFDRAGIRDNLDVSTMIFVYTVQEPRIV